MQRIESRFNSKLIKMIEDINGKFDHYAISSMIRQVLFHSGL